MVIKRSIKVISIKSKNYLRQSVDVNKILIFYNTNDDIRPLCITLFQLIEYAKYFDSNKTMAFKFNDKELLKKYKNRRKISSLKNKEFDSELVYGDNDKY